MDIEHHNLDQVDGKPSVAHSTPIRESREEELESPTRRRRLLPTRHGGSQKLYNEKDEDVIGHIKELRRKLSNEHELNEIDIRRDDDNSEQKFDDSIEMTDQSLLSKDENEVNNIIDKNVDIGEMEIIADGTRHEGVESRKISERENHDDHTPLTTEDQMSATESEADRIFAHLPDDEPVSAEVHNDQKQQLKEMLDELATPYANKDRTSTSSIAIADNTGTQVGNVYL